MKYLLLVVSSIFALSPAFAMQGGETGGGGNGLKSTAEQVIAYFQQYSLAGPQIALEKAYAGLSSKAFSSIRQEPARTILSDIFKLKNVIQCHFNDSDERSDRCPWIFDLGQHPEKLVVKTTGACVENGEDRDASVTFHQDQNGDPVLDSMCFSAERLARYPAEALGTQILALTIHELSHVAGYDETNAIAVQNYAAAKLVQACHIELTTNDLPFASEAFVLDTTDGSFFTVDYEKEFGQDPTSGSISNNTSELNLKLSSFDSSRFTLSFSPEKGGKLQFLSTNMDGTISENEVTWGTMRALGDGYDRAFKTDQVISSRIIFNGKNLIPQHIDISAGCAR